MKVCKFGGTSMASGETVRKVMDIVKRDETRRYIVASAPGKRNGGDVKITDALYAYADGKGSFDGIKKRFSEIAAKLKTGADFAALIDRVKEEIDKASSRDFAASRGEYLSAYILAKALNFQFVDAAELIVFSKGGELLLEESQERIRRRLEGVRYAVIPGFYGRTQDGKIKVFPRGGSDITGSIIAGALKADLYENWTDVDGFMRADPTIVKRPEVIDALSYKELRELAYMGAKVLHPEAIYPVRQASIPINIRNTFRPDAKGTMILPYIEPKRTDGIVTGIAGRTGFTIINIEKEMMNRQIGFVRRALSVLEKERISFEHTPSGIDTLSIVICDEYLTGNTLQKIANGLREALSPDSIEIHRGMSLIATVGRNMASRQGTASAIFTALADRDVNVRMIDQGSSELNIIIGVDTFDYERAIEAIYDGLVRKKQ